MKYMGSKSRFVKDILPIILSGRKKEQWYVEPFAGGMNVIENVTGNRIASDNNKYLIAMWKGIVNGITYPTDIDKELYDLARDVFNGREKRFEHLMNMTDDMVGWIGFMASANGRFFEGGYGGKSNTKIGTVRDYTKESINNIVKQIPKMTGVEFICSDYRELKIPDDSIVYCDIPYKGTKQYSTSKGFNHEEFWNWARNQSTKHKVYISEYSAPNDFVCVWEKKAKSSLSANGQIGGNKESVERLFIHNSFEKTEVGGQKKLW